MDTMALSHRSKPLFLMLLVFAALVLVTTVLVVSTHVASAPVSIPANVNVPQLDAVVAPVSVPAAYSYDWAFEHATHIQGEYVLTPGNAIPDNAEGQFALTGSLGMTRR